MDNSTAEIFERALSLPQESRAELADFLMESLREGADLDSEAAWRGEVNRRLAELNAGNAETVSWESLRQHLHRHTSSR